MSNIKNTPMDYKQFEGHTPAPWKHSVLKGRVLFFSIPEDGFVFMTIEDRHFIASQRHQEWIANARLINAAPDLLKENQELKSELQKQKELKDELVKGLKGLSDYFKWSIGDPQFKEYKEAESLIKKSSEI